MSRSLRVSSQQLRAGEIAASGRLTRVGERSRGVTELAVFQGAKDEWERRRPGRV